MEHTQFLEINGTKIKYHESGQGFPLLFVHAGIADSRMWQDQIVEFSKEFRVITYDMRGYGESPSGGGEYSHYGDLLGLMDALHIERCVLLGCSKGGAVVMDAALAAPERIAGLVVVAGIANGLELGDEVEFVEPRQWEEAVKAFKAGDLERANELEVQMWIDGFNQPVGRGPREVREKVRLMNAIVLQNELNATEGSQKILEPVAGTRLNELSMPVLFISGSLDEPVLLPAIEKMVSLIPLAEHKVFEGVAHLPNMEIPQEFNQLVLDFVRKVSNSTFPAAA
jgi:pimeloyl-ACP methyl ester carboxylesterase